MVRSGYRGLSVHGRALLGPAVLILVFASRLPFLAAGYGNDPDGWLVVKTARHIAQQHEYIASRLPGFPVPELVYSLIWRGGPIVMNGITALLSVAAAGFFMRSLRRLGCSDCAWAGLALALTPVIAINSTTSMDFVWGLTFILASFDFVLAGRPALAGLMLGLATGCRITSGAMLMPLAYLVFARPLLQNPLVRESLLAPACTAIPSREMGTSGTAATNTPRNLRRWPALLRFCVATLLVAAACYSPVFHHYGWGFFSFAEASFRPSTAVAIYRATIRVWGLIGCLGLAAVAAIYLLRRTQRATPLPHNAYMRAATIASAMGIALYVIAYIRHPAKAEYLIPVIPFVILLMARALDRREFRLACACLFVSPFVAGVGSTAALSETFSIHAIRLNTSGSPLVVDLRRGPLLLAHHEREYRQEFIHALLSLGRTLPQGGIVMVGYWLHQLDLSRGDGTAPGPDYVYVVTREKWDQHRAAGKTVYYLPEMTALNNEVTGFDLARGGATPLRAFEGVPDHPTRQ